MCFHFEPCFTGGQQGKHIAELKKYYIFKLEVPSAIPALPIIWKFCTTFFHGISPGICTKISPHRILPFQNMPHHRPPPPPPPGTICVVCVKALIEEEDDHLMAQ